jgi:hypothetical protein
MTDLTRGNTESWFETIWDVIENAERNTDDPEKWDDVKTAMAWLREELHNCPSCGLPHSDQARHTDLLKDVVHHSIKHHQRQLNFIKWHHELEEKKEQERIEALKNWQDVLNL